MMTRLGIHSTETQSSDTTGTTVQNVTPEAALELMKQQGIKVLDIRTASEFATGHIPGAINIDFHAADFETKLGSFTPEKPYVIHCAAGGRSTRSLPAFRKLGFKSIYHLNGGMKAWQNSHLPIER